MGSRIKRPLLTLSIAAAMLLGTSGAIAVTPSPTPKPSMKTTVKATPKPTKKPVVKKPVVKKPVVKKPVVKKRPIYRRTAVGVSPSPAPGWPPKGFRPANGGIFAKGPTTTELLGVLSASPTLAAKFKVCSKYACGVVQVASYSGCTWWEITSTLSGPVSVTNPTIITYGSIRTTAAASKAKQIVTILLISGKALKPNVSVRNINITCYHSKRTETVPTNTYSPNTPSPTPIPTPTPTESPTPTPTESPTPTN